jgi:hypothetical protein
VEDELTISKSAERSLEPWFDAFDDMGQWAVDELVDAADDMRLLDDVPEGWRGIEKPRKPDLYYAEAVGPPTEALLLFQIQPQGVTLVSAYPRPITVHLTRHARERLHERVDKLEPNPERRRIWLNATVDRALRSDSLTLEAPSWAASAPLRPGVGWTTRMLNGDEVALLVSAPHHEGGSWNIVTILSRSTAISIVGRLTRRWKRGTRLLANRIRYRKPAPVRAAATRPPRLGDVMPGRRRHRRGGSGARR